MVAKPLPPRLASDMERYLDFLKYERGYSQHTLDAYQRNLTEVALFVSQTNINQWRQVDQDKLRRFVMQTKQNGLKVRSIQLKISSIKGFFKFLLQRQIIKSDPSELLVVPKADKP